MKLRKKKQDPTARQRKRTVSEDSPKKSAAFSYGANRPDHESIANREAQRTSAPETTVSAGNYWLRRAGLLILLLAITASITSSLTLSADPDIVAVKGSGQNGAFLHSESTYQAAATKVLNQSMLNRNKITVDTDKISTEMIKQFPELSNVSVTLPLLAHRPVIYLETAKPALIINASNGSYILDGNGRALLPSGGLDSSTRDTLPTVVDQSGLEVTLGKQILPAKNIDFITTVVGQLAAGKVKISSLTLPPSASQLDAQIEGRPYYVKFNLQSNDARRQAGTFLATQAQLQRKNTLPSKYIDVRVEGRAYYQ